MLKNKSQTNNKRNQEKNAPSSLSLRENGAERRKWTQCWSFLYFARWKWSKKILPSRFPLFLSLNHPSLFSVFSPSSSIHFHLSLLSFLPYPTSHHPFPFFFLPYPLSIPSSPLSLSRFLLIPISLLYPLFLFPSPIFSVLFYFLFVLPPYLDTYPFSSLPSSSNPVSLFILSPRKMGKGGGRRWYHWLK